MANIAAVLETQHAVEEKLFKKMSELENKWKSTPPQAESSHTRLREELQEFKSHMLSVLQILRDQISGLCKSIDEIEMRHRRKYILISGIPESNNSDLAQFVVNLLNSKLSLDVSAEKLAACHRLGGVTEGKCRPVLVRFTERSLKATVWSKKTAFKGSSHSISEFLTRQRQAVFIDARKRFGIKRCWTMEGNILLKLKDGSKQRLFTSVDLSAIPASEDEPQPQLTKEPTSAAAPSSPESRSRSRRTAKPKK